jgi:CAI-1 autoinducer synthase
VLDSSEAAVLPAGASSEGTRDAGPGYPTWLQEQLAEQRDFIEGLEPFPFDQPADIRPYLSLHQNDYLRLANHPEVVKARAEANSTTRIESFSSSVFGGASSEHNRFIALMRQSLQAGDVMLTTAGWTANVGLIEAVTPPDRPVYIDADAHASMADGIRFSRGRRVMVRHNSPAHLEQRIKIHGPGLVCIDAVYSTDGSVADLASYVEVCERHDCALLVDEAHSFGMFGEQGGGLAVQLGLAERVHFRTISLSKALGGHGGAVAGSTDLLRSLYTCMRPVIFSSATSALLAAGHAKALEIAIREPWRARQCLDMAELLRSRLHERDIFTAGSASHIISVFFRSDEACRFYHELRDRRILTSVFIYPAAPKGISLVRFSLYADLTPADVEYVADCAVEILSRLSPLTADELAALV